ncbi:MAG TPA: 6-carboxytetrahydropterin synthase [Tepidisphaeraceae bacterium]|jgi:6-pyruvoyltetrahydropterin/6-carboxytetrahydropterin synthase|nr:6-carboxytetrahydropterin synthase [Tepidisphaeraceae bacterium]
MFRLTREVRFAVNHPADYSLAHHPTNNYAGYPSLSGFGSFLTLQATLVGNLDPASNYLVNIKRIDSAVRERAIPFVTAVFGLAPLTPEQTVAQLFNRLTGAWPGLELQYLRLALSPFLSYSASVSELPMVRLSQKFEFSATHRLHNPALSETENCRIYGKCNNPHGHGHNYEVQVTLSGTPNDDGILISVPAFETIVASAVIDRFDHKNLNVELPEFRELIPTVENIARVIYGLLKPRFDESASRLAGVTVWETPKTFCEYSE